MPNNGATNGTAKSNNSKSNNAKINNANNDEYKRNIEESKKLLGEIENLLRQKGNNSSGSGTGNTPGGGSGPNRAGNQNALGGNNGPKKPEGGNIPASGNNGPKKPEGGNIPASGNNGPKKPEGGNIPASGNNGPKKPEGGSGPSRAGDQNALGGNTTKRKPTRPNNVPISKPPSRTKKQFETSSLAPSSEQINTPISAAKTALDKNQAKVSQGPTPIRKRGGMRKRKSGRRTRKNRRTK